MTSSSEYNSEYKKRLRKQASDLLGGKCERCGTTGSPNNALEFHHRVPGDNSASTYRRIKEVLAHPERFILLCRVHHLATHKRMIESTKRADPENWPDSKVIWLSVNRP